MNVLARARIDARMVPTDETWADGDEDSTPSTVLLTRPFAASAADNVVLPQDIAGERGATAGTRPLVTVAGIRGVEALTAFLRRPPRLANQPCAVLCPAGQGERCRHPVRKE